MIPLIVGGVVTLLLIGYGFVVICSLIENTGSILFSIAAGVCHAASPLAVLYFGYRCFLRVMPSTDSR